MSVYPSGKPLTVANSPAGFTSLNAKLRRLRIAAIGFEASGGYEKQAANALAAAGFAVYVLNPSQVRNFASSIKIAAKTDPIDAAVIARYLATARDVLLPYQPDPARQRISALAAQRRRLRDEEKEIRSLLDTTSEPILQRMHKRRLAVIDREVAELEAEIKAQIAADAALSQQAERLLSLPGVGPVLTATIIAELREVGSISAKKLTSLVGVAPHARQSGKTTRSGKCGGGRKTVRDVLYMATLSAIRAKMPHVHPFYKRLREAGKPFKVALIAAMRKFLTILNAIMRDNTVFRHSN
jgi:transposase